MWKVFIFCIELNRTCRWTIVTSNKWPIGWFRMNSSDHHFTSHINNSTLSIFQISHLEKIFKFKWFHKMGVVKREQSKMILVDQASHWDLVAECTGLINRNLTVHFQGRQNYQKFSRIFKTKNLHQQLTRVFRWLLMPEGKVLKHNLMHRHILTRDMPHHPSPSLAKIISRSNLWNHILDTCAWVPLKSSGS